MIEERLNDDWNDIVHKALSYAREAMQTTGYNNYLEENYYAIVVDVLKQDDQGMLDSSLAMTVEELATEKNEDQAKKNPLTYSSKTIKVCLIQEL